MIGKSIKQHIARGLTVVAIFTGTFTFQGFQHTTEVEAAIARTTSSVNFRVGPSTNYSVIRKLSSGASIDVISHNTIWSKVTESGTTGYLSTRYIDFTSTGFITGRVNLRSRGRSYASIISKIPAGATVKVLSGPVNGWYKIVWNNLTGFIYKNYVLVKEIAVVSQVKPAAASPVPEYTGAYEGYTKMTWNFSFYTNLPQENGGYTSTALGTKLRYGVLSSNYWPLKSQVILPDWGNFTVEDRGGPNFDSKYRFDLLIPRNSAESDYQYRTRVNQMGIRSISGYIKPNR